MSGAENATLATPSTPRDFHSGATPIWCPGCGDYGVLSALEHALAAHGRPPHEVVLVSGIGCSSRLPAYTILLRFPWRARPSAAALRPASSWRGPISKSLPLEATVMASPSAAITSSMPAGAIWICSILVMDNRVYGMTKGQPSPTTEADWDSDIAPGGLGSATA